MTILVHGARKIDADGAFDGYWLTIEGETITRVGTGQSWRDFADDARLVDAGGAILTPGFIDLHGHGGGGHAYDNGVDEISAALATHRAHGTTRSVISLVANPLERLEQSLGVVAGLVEHDPLVLGTHLEGPFLSVERRGAHNPAFLHAPDPAEIESLLAAGRGTVRQITIAPELPGALDAIGAFVDAGVIVAIGHTNADYDLARDAFERGARLLTHAFNAMPGIHHRSPGPVIAAFHDQRVTIELVLDGNHVHPDVAAMTFRAAPGRVALITDAMAAAGSVDGNYRLGSLNVTVEGGIAMLSGTSTIAGSTLTQDSALHCAVVTTGIEPVAAVEALTATPARVLGLDDELGYLRPGYAADLVLLSPEWQVQRVWAAGTELSLATA
ncbi:N-acetylglucosamine-6-phosphate deacetylase [Compostimonas suwonensis]|uniref:N-acetylglucosamine-6-phosphate deacetylase n=1 Tax=Compostimonas suwonensis TaxID=1048394 RepID=A0A2M9BVD8_9MICO|nr:N-acetylglucosamine-6-phosphate deacetylase [Compostimonas suwonensis]PJJ61908.1 N-acetylglucosamine-6-phosphate deacetylase [Compostimonas suwonensis]